MRRVVTLRHLESAREFPIDRPTIVGRSEAYYRYRDCDGRATRLTADVAETLSALNYLAIDFDTCISRTHGFFDPEGPHLADLETTNGTWLNGERAPAFVKLGVGSPLADGDWLRIGRQNFVVSVSSVGEDSHFKNLLRGRHAVVLTDGTPTRRASGSRLARHLAERKGFAVKEAIFGADSAPALRGLAERADDDGITVLAIRAEVEGEHVLAHGGRVPFERIVRFAAKLRGRKVIVLESDGDPAGCEAVVASQAPEDVVLLASPGDVKLEPGLAPSPGTCMVGQMRASLSGKDLGLRGAFDCAIDGIEAMIGADSNRLDFSWLQGYAGRLAVTFGVRRVDPSSAVCQSVRIGTTLRRVFPSAQASGVVSSLP